MRAKIPRMLTLTILAGCCWIAAAPATERSAAADTTAVSDSQRAALEGRAAALFKKSCATAGCHVGAHPKARLSLEAAKIAAMADAPSRQIDTLKLVDTKRPERSYVLMKIRGDKGIRGDRMPDNRPPLSAEELKAIALWAESLRPPAPADQGKKKP